MCGRWNLTPLEERWEAVEDCEREFRQTRLRVSSDNIGLAALPDGLELIRIGRPLRSELAVWRYGTAFAYRRRRFDRIMTATRAARVAVGGLVGMVGLAIVAGRTGPLAIGLGVGAGLGVMEGAALLTWYHRAAARIRSGEALLTVRRSAMALAELLLSPSQSEASARWELRVHHIGGVETLGGDAAQRAAGTLLTSMNWSGARTSHVRAATDLLVEAGDSQQYVLRTAALLGTDRFATMPDGVESSAWEMSPDAPVMAWGRLSDVRLLALEMAIHDDSERQALEGELALLAQAWREAEEIAAIADSLLLPPGVEAFLKKHRRR